MDNPTAPPARLPIPVEDRDADPRPGAQMPVGSVITRAPQYLSRTTLRVDHRNCQDEATGSSQGTRGFFR
jgi:hypothetical protein